MVCCITGSSGFAQEFINEDITVFLIVYLCVLSAVWITGEYFYRKRHRKKHQPLIENISAQLKELSEE